MALLPDVSFPIIELLISVITTVFTLVGAFILALWYWGLDRETEVYDEKLRTDIEEDSAFSGIRRAAWPNFIATSDSKTSKVISWVKAKAGNRSEKPDKIVTVEGDTIEDRKIEMIRERVREIPGKNILARELVETIRNYYAYKLALSTEDVGSRVVEHFRSRLDECEYIRKVDELGDPEHYDEIILIDGHDSSTNRDTLNDVFLRLVRAAEIHCVNPISDVNERHEEIENCREFLMLSFFGLWAKRVKGVEVNRELAEDECLSEYRADVRDNDSWGYWLLPMEKCDEEEFARLRHMAWCIRRIIDEYWRSGVYSLLYPQGDSIKEMEQVATPFLICLKNEEEFRGGGPGGPD